jgi:hypothetical protein
LPRSVSSTGNWKHRPKAKMNLMKTGFQKVKQITMPAMNAISDQISRDRSSARCSISGAWESSI